MKRPCHQWGLDKAIQWPGLRLGPPPPTELAWGVLWSWLGSEEGSQGGLPGLCPGGSRAAAGGVWGSVLGGSQGQDKLLGLGVRQVPRVQRSSQGEGPPAGGSWWKQRLPPGCAVAREMGHSRPETLQGPLSPPCRAHRGERISRSTETGSHRGAVGLGWARPCCATPHLPRPFFPARVGRERHGSPA